MVSKPLEAIFERVFKVLLQKTEAFYDFFKKSSKSILTHCNICKKYTDFKNNIIFYDLYVILVFFAIFDF